MGLLWVRISSLSSYLGKTLFPPRFKAHFPGCCISGWQSLSINNLNISFNSLWAYMIFVEKLAKYRWLSIICDLRVLLFLVFSFCPVLLAFDYLGERCCFVWVFFFFNSWVRISISLIALEVFSYFPKQVFNGIGFCSEIPITWIFIQLSAFHYQLSLLFKISPFLCLY